MRDIAVGQAQVGDVVAEPVVNAQGRVLLPRGARLSPAVLSRLTGWGVSRLRVEGDAPGAPAAPAAEGPGDADAALDARFAAWEGDELMMAIKAIARRHLSRR